ncbi:hypothetical protein [Mycobacterium sp. shizuoka-1]|uniref:hypothetical protein n=1 Tax=Mycobacterium sp. shizuoka-1 TaxID=2039281 RepID=UPI000C062E79|nr:hypothetical protein [Mycobacterium sp. shizuoka-1]GAY13921.1 hypothetical protein MSZK_06470 [Mycobacterium sp. shizuoka-1]
MREVAIIGAGPGGLTVAHLLQSGIDDFVNSQGDTVYHRPETIFAAWRFSRTSALDDYGYSTRRAQPADETAASIA